LGADAEAKGLTDEVLEAELAACNAERRRAVRMELPQVR
jgi:hypothetical protein